MAMRPVIGIHPLAAPCPFQLFIFGDASTVYICIRPPARLPVSGVRYLGYASVGSTFTQNGGAANVGNNTDSVGSLILANSTGSNGSYNLNSGTLNLFGSETIGNAGQATFTQTGGANTIASSLATAALYIGETAMANGLYALGPAGSLQVTNGEEDVGVNGNGTFTQSGGTNTTGIGAGASTLGFKSWVPPASLTSTVEPSPSTSLPAISMLEAHSVARAARAHSTSTAEASRFPEHSRFTPMARSTKVPGR